MRLGVLSGLVVPVVVVSSVGCSLGSTAEPEPATVRAPILEVPTSEAAIQTEPATGDSSSEQGAAGAPIPGEELEELIAGRYEAYWDGLDAARREPTADPARDVPMLAELAAGEQLDVSYQALTELAESGDAIREPDTPAIGGIDADSEHRVRIDRIDGTVAEVSACLVNDDVRFSVDSGAVVRESVSTVLSSATMALTAGRWKLIRSRAVEIGDGVSGCWLTGDAEFPY